MSGDWKIMPQLGSALGFISDPFETLLIARQGEVYPRSEVNPH
jgi:hypothetical protein